MAKSKNEIFNSKFSSAARSSIIPGVVLLLFGVLTLILNYIYNYDLQFLGIGEVIIGIALFLASIITAKSKKAEFIKALEDFSFCTEDTAKAAVLNFPAPFVITDSDGRISWNNTLFSDMVGRENMFGENLTDILPDLKISRFIEEPYPEPEEMIYNNRYYTISGSTVSIGSGEGSTVMLGVYFTDNTDEKIFRRECEDKRLVECIAIIDNYDEVFRNTPNSSHGSLIGEIERVINEWVESGLGISRRYERDKFIIVFEYGEFKKLESEKFTVLNNVRMINMENKIPVTLSIGVGKYGENIDESDKMARLALEMALGRGGDQAVVKSPDSLDFYGAKAREIDKNTKVKARVVAHTLTEFIDQAENVLIMGHQNGDMDSLGAEIGILNAARFRGKRGYIVLNKNTTNAKAVLKNFLDDSDYQDVFINGDYALDVMTKSSLLVVVDTHRPSMLEYPDVLSAAKSVVLIDHHRRCEEYIENPVLVYHEPYSSSTCEMVAEMLQYILEDNALGTKEAEALYAGIYMDTKGFTFKTGVRTFEAASYLRRRGVDPVAVKRLFRNDIEGYIQKSKIISNAQLYRGNIAIAFCDEHAEDMRVIVAQAADDLLNITGVEASFVLAKIGNKIVISGRSLETVNVQLILEKLGGGGHVTIAGAQLENSGIGIAEVKLKNAIDEVLYDEEPTQ